ncbi:MAG: sodium-independent anion transporter, partial [Chromatiaceae bacterium]|nr:sodium-independent anion transporter [Chromatiaceae bacterium]
AGLSPHYLLSGLLWEGTNPAPMIAKVCIDVSRAHFWDITTVTALDKVVLKFRREGTEVEVVGLNQASRTLVDRFAVHDKPQAVESLMGH